jgi:hypothetical protein
MGPFPRFAALVAIMVAVAVARADSTRMPRKDASLPLKEYLEKGMPSLDKPWKKEDYKKAAEVLATLDPASYPRSGSLRSGVLFARMTDISSLKSEILKLPVKQRMVRLTDLQTIEAVAQPYFRADKQQMSNYDRELIAFVSAALPLDRALVDALDELKATVPPQQAARMEAQVNVTVALSLADLLTDIPLLYSKSPMDESVHRALFQTLSEHLPPLMKSFDQVQRDRIIAEMQTAQKNERDEVMRKEIADFVDSLSKQK